MLIGKFVPRNCGLHSRSREEWLPQDLASEVI